MSRTDDKFKHALEGKSIPILTLDHKWHRLFTQTGATPEIKALEEQLNDLIKRQGKLNTDMKNIKALKSKLMQGIVSSMEANEEGNKSAGKKMDESKRLIEDCNEKLEACQDELLDMPREISQINYQLMLATMDICYDKIKSNTDDIESANQWIADFKQELKKRVLAKQEKERWNHELYTYMHDIFGTEVIEIFDMKYIPEFKTASKREEPSSSVDKNTKQTNNE